MTNGIVLLTGGVGGSKLVDGLMRSGAADTLTAIVNTADDFRHFGLSISPDIDTLLYTLSGKANRELGWGREGESWNFMASLRSLGGADWFNLGDGDLALHIMRTSRLAAGDSLSDITAYFAQSWGIPATILPMSDDPVATMLLCDEGVLEFQRYFVERQCAPIVRSISFDGADEARAAKGVIAAIETARVIFIAPSNPWLSIDPILAIPDIAAALRKAKAPIIAVSPLVQGRAVKGPTAKLMAELGHAIDNTAIAKHYGGLLDGMLVHQGDDAPPGIAVAACDTLMPETADRVRVAQQALLLATSLT